MTRALRVLRTGPMATIQDRGRPGWLASGVGVSGAADPESLRLANQLVGNAADAAGLECLLGGLILEALGPLVLAITGAPAPAHIDDRPVRHATVLALPAGARLQLGIPLAGLRTYVALRGGIAVPEVLGSRSRDTLAGIGPEPLEPGCVLPVGSPPDAATATAPVTAPSITNDPIVLRVALGPRDDWFTDPSALFQGRWTASDAVDRVGARLVRGPGEPPLIRAHDHELPTEGMPLGAIQVPPSGQPVIFLADHPITGGYPVIGCVLSADVGRAAQARPGQHIIFRPASEGMPHETPPTPASVRIAGHPSDVEVAAVLGALTALSAGHRGVSRPGG